MILCEGLASEAHRGYHVDKGGRIMTKKKKLALIKKGVKALEPVLREEAALVPAAGKAFGKKAAEGVV